MLALPVRDISALTGDGRVMVLAPHPDDESLGCGGFIAEACGRGHKPLVAVLTDGAGSHPNSQSFPRERLVQLRAGEARQALAELGLSSENVLFLGQPDTAAPHSGPAFESLLDEVTEICRAAEIRTILAPWRHDPHCDHEAAHLLIKAVTRKAGLRHVAYPVWGWTLPTSQKLDGPVPVGMRLDIARHLSAKRRAIAAHRSQWSGLISDDPSGFQLPADLLVVFERPFETFLTEP